MAYQTDSRQIDQKTQNITLLTDFASLLRFLALNVLLGLLLRDHGLNTRKG